jgi:hypothetical protein
MAACIYASLRLLLHEVHQPCTPTTHTLELHDAVSNCAFTAGFVRCLSTNTSLRWDGVWSSIVRQRWHERRPDPDRDLRQARRVLANGTYLDESGRLGSAAQSSDRVAVCVDTAGYRTADGIALHAPYVLWLLMSGFRIVWLHGWSHGGLPLVPDLSEARGRYARYVMPGGADGYLLRRHEQPTCKMLQELEAQALEVYPLGDADIRLLSACARALPGRYTRAGASMFSLALASKA